jgi:hypothetical protein
MSTANTSARKHIGIRYFVTATMAAVIFAGTGMRDPVTTICCSAELVSSGTGVVCAHPDDQKFPRAATRHRAKNRDAAHSVGARSGAAACPRVRVPGLAAHRLRSTRGMVSMTAPGKHGDP